jgi:hypothetical protein
MKKIILIFAFLFSFLCFGKPSNIWAADTSPILGMFYGYYQMSPLVGTDYVSQLMGSGILARYDLPGVRETVKQQLAQMKQDGVEAIRINLPIWNTVADPEFQTTLFGNTTPRSGWGWIPADDQKILEPYRTNVANYAADVKAAGFTHFMISYGARYPNKQTGEARAQRDFPMLVDTFDLMRKNGPSDIKIDLYGEGVPSDFYPSDEKNWDMAYCTEILKLYYQHYGTNDAVVSFIANGPHIPSMVSNLLTIYANAGLTPPWVQFSLYPDPSIEDNTLVNLQSVDKELKNHNLSTTPILVEETFYGSPEVARGISRFMATSSRPILWLFQWPILTDSLIAHAPPYDINSYAQYLKPLNISLWPISVTKTEKYNVTTGYKYSGYLEIKYTRCDLSGNNCVNNNGNAPEKWCYYATCFMVNNGSVTLDMANMPDVNVGKYSMQFRPWGFQSPWSNAVNLTISNSTLLGDLDHNGKVDIFDYNILLQNPGNTTCGNMADIDANCKVDIFDYNILVGNFGKIVGNFGKTQ